MRPAFLWFIGLSMGRQRGCRRYSARTETGGGDSVPGADFLGQPCGNETHESKTASELSFMGHMLMENRNGLMVNSTITPADGRAERYAAKSMIRTPGRPTRARRARHALNPKRRWHRVRTRVMTRRSSSPSCRDSWSNRTWRRTSPDATRRCPNRSPRATVEARRCNAESASSKASAGQDDRPDSASDGARALPPDEQ